jgi:hypothetical protein
MVALLFKWLLAGCTLFVSCLVCLRKIVILYPKNSLCAAEKHIKRASAGKIKSRATWKCYKITGFEFKGRVFGI